jgi:hypothetical protein
MAYSEGGYESDMQSATDADGNPLSAGQEPITSIDSGSDSGRSSWRDDSSTGYTSYHDYDDRYRNAGSSWFLWRFVRRLFGMDDGVVPGAGRLTAEQLTRLARDGHDLHPDYCHQSVAHVTDRLGIAGLSGIPADQQVAYMRQNWSTVDARAAQDQANQGFVVIAGLADAGMAHTAIVTPGSGSTKLDGAFYPNVTCGGPSNARSDGSRTVGDVWSPLSRDNVQYFVAQ